jgi:hypothetical protein
MELSPVGTAEHDRSACSDVEEQRFSAASEARRKGTEPRRGRQNTTDPYVATWKSGASARRQRPEKKEPSPGGTAEDDRAASSEVEERRFSAAAEARENGTESRRDGRNTARVRNKTHRQHRYPPLQRTQEPALSAVEGTGHPRLCSWRGNQKRPVWKTLKGQPAGLSKQVQSMGQPRQQVPEFKGDNS